MHTKHRSTEDENGTTCSTEYAYTHLFRSMIILYSNRRYDVTPARERKISDKKMTVLTKS